jgi:hypothetical protein
VILLLVITVIAIGAVLYAQSTAAKTVTVQKYTVIPVILDNTISSATNKVGDVFQVHCYTSDCGGFPAKTAFVGKLTVAQPKQANAPGVLKAHIFSAILPDGTQVPVKAVASSDQGVPKEGVTGQSPETKKRRTGTVAGGTIGAIAGGWGGAAVGAGAGYLTGKAVEGKYTDATVPAGTKGYIALTAPAKYKVK